MAGVDANERIVSAWLHRVVTLIALATGEAWQVRTKPLESSMRPAAVPDDWPKPRVASFGPESGLEAVPRPLPDWVRGAWDLLEYDRALAAALSTWHQGLLLNAVHPSFAMVAYCGTIETIAESVSLRHRIKATASPCSECGNVPRAQARFWETVALVRTAEEVDSMRRVINPYGRRSKSAHGSELFGVEVAFGSMHLMIYSPPTESNGATMQIDEKDPTQLFMWRDVPIVRAVAADLLTMVLTSDFG
jgi:hypothetical protein